MSQAFHLGGWGMYPTTISGLILVLSSILYARRPEAGRLHLVRCLSVLTLLLSGLGFVTGVIKSFVSPTDGAQDLGRIVVVGVGESLTNIGLGLLMLVAAWIAIAIGAARPGSSPRATVRTSPVPAGQDPSPAGT